MSIKDKLMAGHDDLRDLYVESLDETIYARRFTLAQQKPVAHFFEGDGLDPEAVTEIVVRYCLDETGTRIFNREDRKDLMGRADFHVMCEIAAWVVGAKAKTVQDHEKNSDGEDIELQS